jgi:hypothetical protein
MTNQGWECPRCHYCYSPTQPACIRCNSQPVTTVTTGYARIGEWYDSVSLPTYEAKNVKMTTGPVSTSLTDMIEAGQVAGGWQPHTGINKGYNR